MLRPARLLIILRYWWSRWERPSGSATKNPLTNNPPFFPTLALAVFLSGCASVPDDWLDVETVERHAPELKIGDILITPKDWTRPISWFGHSAVIVNENLEVGEYPKLGFGYFQVPLANWFSTRNQVRVLRYKNIDENFRARLAANNQKLTDLDYGLESEKETLLARDIDEQTDFYCSSYIWYLYAKTAADFGISLDIDGDRGAWVMPYDFLRSDELRPLPIETP